MLFTVLCGLSFWFFAALAARPVAPQPGLVGGVQRRGGPDPLLRRIPGRPRGASGCVLALQPRSALIAAGRGRRRAAGDPAAGDRRHLAPAGWIKAFPLSIRIKQVPVDLGLGSLYQSSLVTDGLLGAAVLAAVAGRCCPSAATPLQRRGAGHRGRTGRGGDALPLVLAQLGQRLRRAAQLRAGLDPARGRARRRLHGAAGPARGRGAGGRAARRVRLRRRADRQRPAISAPRLAWRGRGAGPGHRRRARSSPTTPASPPSRWRSICTACRGRSRAETPVSVGEVDVVGSVYQQPPRRFRQASSCFRTSAVKGGFRVDPLRGAPAWRLTPAAIAARAPSLLGPRRRGSGRAAPERLILVLHNRYRTTGGEERAVEDLLWLIRERLGEDAELLARDSASVGRAAGRRGAARRRAAPRRGRPGAVRRTGARIVHAHNLHPTLGWRALAAARDAGARVVLHLHQYRLVCAVGVCFTHGEECTRCHGRNTLPGVLRNCRGSLAEAVTYGAALALWQPRARVAGRRVRCAQRVLAASGCTSCARPSAQAHVLPHVIRAVRRGSRRAATGIALVVSRLAPEKGVEVAIEACRIAGIPLVVAGDGPERERWPRRAGPAVTFAGRVDDASCDGCARAPLWRSCRLVRARRSGWRRRRRWPPACRSPRRGSARCPSSSPTTGWCRRATHAALAAAIARLRGDRGRRAGDRAIERVRRMAGAIVAGEASPRIDAEARPLAG